MSASCSASVSMPLARAAVPVADDSLLLPDDLVIYHTYDIEVVYDERQRCSLNDEVAAWCAESLRGKWCLYDGYMPLTLKLDLSFGKRHHPSNLIRFTEAADRLLFRLRWL